MQLDMSLEAMLLSCSSKSPQIRSVMLAAIASTIWLIWSSRNALRFDNICFSFEGITKNVVAAVRLSDSMVQGRLFFHDQDSLILRSFNISGRPSPLD